MCKKTRFNGAAAILLLLLVPIQFATAQEVIVQNDSLSDGANGNIQAGFAIGESAASWLTSPCDGNIVAVQVYWKSVTGTEPQSIEDSIRIFQAGTFPTPGAELEAIIGPQMTDSFTNEYRFLDDMLTIPLLVPVTNGQGFVVSFKFSNAPNAANGPSIVTDTGCQAGKNAIDASGFGWISSCALGVSGDFFIRAVVDCGALPGACCEVGGGCNEVTSASCIAAGGAYRGDGVTCGSITCDESCCFGPGNCLDLTVANCGLAAGFNQGPGSVCATTTCFPTGACCNTDGSCTNDVLDTDCAASGGAFQGDQVQCTAGLCPQPDGACCLSGGGCLLLNETDCGVIPNSSWAGALTDCTDANSNSIADDCEILMPVPTVSEWGVLTMMLLITVVGTMVIRLKQPVR